MLIGGRDDKARQNKKGIDAKITVVQQVAGVEDKIAMHDEHDEGTYASHAVQTVESLGLQNWSLPRAVSGALSQQRTKDNQCSSRE
jgi:hypothetical protein